MLVNNDKKVGGLVWCFTCVKPYRNKLHVYELTHTHLCMMCLLTCAKDSLAWVQISKSSGG